MSMNAATQTNNQQIAALYANYGLALLAYLRRMVDDHQAGEDLCQETFIKAMRGWEQRDTSANVDCMAVPNCDQHRLRSFAAAAAHPFPANRGNHRLRRCLRRIANCRPGACPPCAGATPGYVPPATGHAFVQWPQHPRNRQRAWLLE